MKPYLICLDLDGTLLNDNKEISDYTKQVLTTLKSKVIALWLRLEDHTVQAKFIIMN